MLVYEGDSQSYDPNYPAQVSAHLSAPAVRANVSTGGQTLAQMITDGPTQVDALFRSANMHNVCVIWGGTNDMFFGASGATAYSRIVTYCQARRAAGFGVVVLTALPRSDSGTPGGYEAERLAFNASVRSNWATFADALSDIALDSRIGDAGDETNATYFQGDLVHLNSTGTQIAADITYLALRSIGVS